MCIVVATNTTIGPAVETVAADSTDLDVDYFLFESAQLTKEILTSLNLSEVSLFGFSNTTAATKGSVATCKSLPGDAYWPSKTEWSFLDLLLDGALIQSIPAAAVCYRDWPQYDAAKCASVTANWNSPQFQCVESLLLTCPPR